MKLEIITIFMFLLVLIGCSDTNRIESSHQYNEKTAVKNTDNVDVEAVVKKKDNNSGRQDGVVSKQNATISADKSITLNGHKFKILGGKFTQGVRVADLTMNEYGTVRGSFVVVLVQGAEISAPEFKSVNHIADNTYRVWPLKGVDLLNFYQMLLKNTHYATVEVDIDYSPISSIN